MASRVSSLVLASILASVAGTARADGNLPVPFVVDASMGMRDFPGDGLALLGGSARLSYRPTSHCLHLFVEGFAGSTLASDATATDALLVTGSLGALWGRPTKTTFFGVGVGVDLGFGRLANSGVEERGFTSIVAMRALLRSRLRKAFHVHAGLMLGAVVRPLTLDIAGRSEGFEGMVLGFDLGASFDLGLGNDD